MISDAEWRRIRGELRFGQVFTGTVVNVPRPGAIGIFVDIGLDVGGFVDVVHLPRTRAEARWPVEGTVTRFEVWWAADEPQQIRLRPLDPAYRCDDFAEYVERWRPGWPEQVGQIVEPQ